MQYISFAPYDLQADRFWRQASCQIRGLYWSLITDLYTEGGRLPYKPDEIRRCCNWDDEKDGDFTISLQFVLKEKFKKVGKYIYHKRVTEELRKAQEARDKKVMAGRAGGTATAMMQQCCSDDAAMLDNRKETKRKEDKRKETKEPEPLETPKDPVKFFEVYNKLSGLLGPLNSQSDQTNLRNILLFLFNKKDDSIWSPVLTIAAKCKTAKKPLALFNTKIKQYYNWSPQSAFN